jgi:hypothetical protein
MMIGFARRWQKPGSGSILKLTDVAEMQEWPDLTVTLRHVRWAIAGAVATRHYMPERATKDLDIVVMTEDGPAAAEALSRAGFIRLAELAIPGSSWRAPSGQEVDVLLVEGERWSSAIARARERRDPSASPVLALPDLVLMKLQAGRSQDVADVVRMLGFADDRALEKVRTAVRTEAPELADDLESMIELGKLEHQAEPER